MLALLYLDLPKHLMLSEPSESGYVCDRFENRSSSTCLIPFTGLSDAYLAAAGPPRSCCPKVSESQALEVESHLSCLIVQVTALQIASLKRVNRRSQILLLDRSGSTSKVIAKELGKRGFKKIRVVQVKGQTACRLFQNCLVVRHHAVSIPSLCEQAIASKSGVMPFCSCSNAQVLYCKFKTVLSISPSHNCKASCLRWFAAIRLMLFCNIMTAFSQLKGCSSWEDAGQL